MPFSSDDADLDHLGPRRVDVEEIPYVERRLIELRHAFDAGVELAAVEVMLLCLEWKLPWPAWVQEEAIAIVLTVLTRGDKSKGRKGNWIAKCRTDYVHLVRYEVAREIRRAQIVGVEGVDLGRTEDDCWAEASKFLRGTIARGAVGVMKRSYKLVERSLRPSLTGIPASGTPSGRFTEMPLLVRHFGFDRTVEEASDKPIDEALRRLSLRKK